MNYVSPEILRMPSPLMAELKEGGVQQREFRELNEVLALSDRIAVMYRGKFAAVMPAGDATEEGLGEYMIGTRKGSAA